MGYWGWRALISSVFISVFIVACTSTRPSTPETPPTVSPVNTLITRFPATFTPNVPPIVFENLTPIPTIHTQIAIDGNQPPQTRAVPPLDIHLTPPVCYRDGLNDVLCFGEISHQARAALTAVDLRFVLMDDNNDTLNSQQIRLPYLYLPDSTVLPYHIRFEQVLGDVAQVDVQLVAYRTLRVNDSGLTVDSLRGAWEELRYVVAGQLFNTMTTTTDQIQIVVTVYDDAGRISGYRIRELSTLSAGSNVDFQVALLPFAPYGDSLTYTVTALGTREE